MINFYEILGVNKNASKDEIKTAYKNLVKKYHPDVNKDDSANKIIRNLNEAKEILLDDEKRNEYDKKLDELLNAKQFSKEKSETYSSKHQEYKNTYSKTYVSRWEYFVNYFNVSVDKLFKKLIKSFLVLINYLFFLFLKCICYVILYIFYLFQSLINFISSIFFIFSLITIVTGYVKSNSFNTVNFKDFFTFFNASILIQIIKIVVLNKSVNIVMLIQKLHDKLFICILNKI